MTDKICIIGAGVCVILAAVMVVVVFGLTGGYTGWGTGKK